MVLAGEEAVETGQQLPHNVCMSKNPGFKTGVLQDTGSHPDI